MNIHEFCHYIMIDLKRAAFIIIFNFSMNILIRRK